MERKTTENQLVCGKRRCRNGLQANNAWAGTTPLQPVSTPLENPIKIGIKNGVANDRPWRIVASPELSPSAFRSATTNEPGLAVFDLIRHRRHGEDAVLIAFDLIELEGEDLRRTPLEQRKRKLAKLVRGPHPGIVLNEVFEGDGDVLFEHASKLGCEGIVSKRIGSPYRSGRSPHWVKVKNPKVPAVRREAEEDWGR
jgi:hypothetical protein